MRNVADVGALGIIVGLLSALAAVSATNGVIVMAVLASATAAIIVTLAVLYSWNSHQ